ncbi:MAG: hypothetical protein A2293_10740 [Elusimicrobia bacterium RIFOXYB2_FULL_49_7]|nr:MAG: hypothetical protein A2293_10740 [Elusimicrobia bacterium RIFOXYB2_FULL_49_7]
MSRTPPPHHARYSTGHVPLNRALSKMGLFSRKEAEEYIFSGRIKVAGKVCRDPFFPVSPEKDLFAFNDTPLFYAAKRTVLLHKPRGVVTTRSDEKGRKNVFDLHPDAFRGLHAVGRLDRASSGLLLLTNDTRFSSDLTDPQNAIPRRYVVTVTGRIEEKHLEQLKNGLLDKGEFLKVSDVMLRKASGRESHLLVTLTEGKNREIRRLFKTLGRDVTRLKRIAFGKLELGTLEAGAFRVLSETEVREIGL